MRLAFAIVSLFPSGGLQRDCMAIARMLAEQGHEVTIFTSRLTGDVSGDLRVEILPVRAWTNHGRNSGFSREIVRRWAGQFDRDRRLRQARRPRPALLRRSARSASATRAA